MLPSKGILVIADTSREWLLPWWESHVRKYSSLPIAFMDFGMTEKAAAWCKQKGIYIDISHYRKQMEALECSIPTKMFWGQLFSKRETEILDFQPYCHIKSLGMQHTPFEKTLYMDVDCEVRKPMDGLFTALDRGSFWIAPDLLEWQANLLQLGLCYPEETIYNTGVILYAKDSPILKEWAKETLIRGPTIPGDQELLSHVIYENHFEIGELDKIWNFHRRKKLNKEVVILHWIGQKNKLELLKELAPSVEVSFSK